MAPTLSARMLNADEERLFIGTPSEAGDFAFPGPHLESPDLTAHEIADQHLIIAMDFVISGIRILAVGSNPKATLCVECKPVWRVKHIIRRYVLRASMGIIVYLRVSS